MRTRADVHAQVHGHTHAHSITAKALWGERERDLQDINFVGVRKIWLYHEQCDLKMQKKNSDIE